MKHFPFELEGRKRILGYSTGNDDISVAHIRVDSLLGEHTHFHAHSAEYYITVSGAALMWVEGTIVELKPGSIICVQKGEVHRVYRITQAPLELYAIKVPDAADDKVVVADPPALAVLIAAND